MRQSKRYIETMFSEQPKEVKHTHPSGLQLAW